jgi:cytoskeletal protein RodZ
MGHLGDLLHQRQLSLGLSLSDLQARTKIREKYIRAILEGDYGVVPGEVYLRGFIRSIANELGIDPGEAMQAYYQDLAGGQKGAEVAPAQKKPEVEQQPAVRSEAVAKAPPTRVSRSRVKRRSGLSPVALVVGLLVLLVAGYWYWSNFMQVPPVDPPEGENPIVGQNLEDREDPDPEQSEDPEQPEEPPLSVVLTNPGETNPNYVVSPGPLQVKLTTTSRGRCWVRVETDPGTDRETAQQTYIGYLETDDQFLVVEAEQQVYVRAGYPSVLILEINGQNLGVLGGTGTREITVSVAPTP